MMAAFALSTNAMAMSAGTYERKIGDGSSDILVVNQNDTMNLELTRQVGGASGPTVCRVKQWGNVISEDSKYIQYQIKFVYITAQTGPGLSNAEDCARYVGEVNGRASTGSVLMSLIKSEYTKK